MKNYFIFSILSLLLFYGCSKDSSDIVDPVSANENNNVYVVSVDAPDTLTFSHSVQLPTSIVLTNPDKIGKVKVSIASFSDDNELLNVTLPYRTLINNNKVVYNGTLDLDSNFTSGKYSIYYNVYLITGENEKLAIKYFFIKRLSANTPPVISNLVMPDSVSFNELFTFHINVFDANGANDIKSVYYKLYKPDGTLVTNSNGISEFPLSDNGDTSESGDITAGDGIFTMKLLIPSGQPSGVWRMDFQASDFQDSLSNIISHNLTVQ